MIQTPSGEGKRERDKGRTEEYKENGRKSKRKLARVNVSSIDEPSGSHYIRLALTAAASAAAAVAVAARERKDSGV